MGPSGFVIAASAFAVAGTKPVVPYQSLPRRRMNWEIAPAVRWGFYMLD